MTDVVSRHMSITRSCSSQCLVLRRTFQTSLYFIMYLWKPELSFYLEMKSLCNIKSKSRRTAVFVCCSLLKKLHGIIFQIVTSKGSWFIKNNYHHKTCKKPCQNFWEKATHVCFTPCISSYESQNIRQLCDLRIRGLFIQWFHLFVVRRAVSALIKHDASVTKRSYSAFSSLKNIVIRMQISVCTVYSIDPELEGFFEGFLKL